LKTASKKTVIILPISILKLNHLVGHILSFNFVETNVNLLEKQLSTVYFKDVRFPWVTLYFSSITVLKLLQFFLEIDRRRLLSHTSKFRIHTPASIEHDLTYEYAALASHTITNLT